jgi:sugar phosphate isomerase/epimerase
MSEPLTRRKFISLAGVAALACMAPATRLSAAADSSPSTAPSSQPFTHQRYKIGASDWMMLKRQKLGALSLAKKCGLDGVEVDMGSLGDRPDMKNELRKPEVRQQYLETSRQLGIEICSLAMSAFFGQSWVDHPKCDQFTNEWIDLMQAMNVPVGFLPMGVKINIKDDAEAISHLKRAAPRAEKANVVLGIETSLDTDGYKRFLDDVASPAVRIYYNFADQLKASEDIYKQLADLGRDRICQIHCTEADGAWLSHGTLDMPRIKQVLDSIGWSGWLVLERARLKGKSVQENFSANAAYLKTVFQTASSN